MVAEQWKVHEELRHQMTDVKDRMATMEETFDKAIKPIQRCRIIDSLGEAIEALAERAADVPIVKRD